MSCHSKACLETPVARSGVYAEKGRWTEIDSRKTYITGPSNAERAILYVYDVFGFKPQSIQGADILAHSAAKPTIVVIVDWFDGEAMQEEWLSSDEGQKLMVQFLNSRASPADALPAMVDVLSKLKTEVFPQIKAWGAVGFCWGGKLVSMLASKGQASPITVAGQSSPARLEPEEAKNITIPMVVLASSKEAGERLDQYEKNLTGEKHVEVFESQLHGWMSARADLAITEERQAYERGYGVFLTFFDKHL